MKNQQLHAWVEASMSYNFLDRPTSVSGLFAMNCPGFLQIVWIMEDDTGPMSELE